MDKNAKLKDWVWLAVFFCASVILVLLNNSRYWAVIEFRAGEWIALGIAVVLALTLFFKNGKRQDWLYGIASWWGTALLAVSLREVLALVTDSLNRDLPLEGNFPVAIDSLAANAFGGLLPAPEMVPLVPLLAGLVLTVPLIVKGRFRFRRVQYVTVVFFVLFLYPFANQVFYPRHCACVNFSPSSFSVGGKTVGLE